MKYDDTYSMIGAIINQGFETQFEKERKKKKSAGNIFENCWPFWHIRVKDSIAEIIKKRSVHVWRTVGREHKKNQHSSGFVERKSHKMQKCGLQIFSVIL